MASNISRTSRRVSAARVRAPDRLLEGNWKVIDRSKSGSSRDVISGIYSEV